MKWLDRGSSAIILLMFLSADAFATSYEGRVQIRGSRNPIANATIFILPHQIRISANDNGDFTTDNIPEGPFRWVINLPGYQKFEQEDQSAIPPDQTATRQYRKFAVEATAAYVYETTVTANEATDGSLRKTKTKKAQALPGAGLDPVKAIQNNPGVNRTPGFGSQVIIQGSAPRDTRYAIDGHEIPLIFHFGGLSSVLIPELSQDIEFYSAGYQVPFGRAIGGIINITSQDLDSKQARGMAYLDIFNAGGAAETPIGDNQHLAIGMRASYVGSILKSIAKENDNFNLSVAPSFQDLSLLYRYRIAPDLDFKMLAIGSKDNLEFILNEPIGDDPLLRGEFSNQIGFFRLIPQLNWTHSKTENTKLSLGLGRDFIDVKIGEQYFYLRTYAMTARADHEMQFSPTWTTNFGFDHQFSWSDVGFLLPEFNNDGGIVNPVSVGRSRLADLKGVESHAMALYFNNRVKPELDSRWTFYPGARLDYYSLTRDLIVSPRLSSRYQINPSLGMVALGGLFAQPPEEQFSVPPYGNNQLKGEKAWHAALRAEQDLSENLSRGSEVTSGFFYKSLFDLIVASRTSSIYSNEGTGKSYGWESSFKYPVNQWNFYLAYTLSKATRKDPINGENPFQYDQTHIATAITSVDLPKNWRISARYRYVTGALDTIPAGSTFDADNDVYIPIRGSLFNTRLQAFSQLDLRFDKKWIYDSWTLSLYLDIQNTLNTKNAEGLQNSFDYRTRENVSGIPVLPTFGLKGEF